LPEIREKKIGSELHWIWKIDPTDANLSVAVEYIIWLRNILWAKLGQMMVVRIFVRHIYLVLPFSSKCRLSCVQYWCNEDDLSNQVIYEVKCMLLPEQMYGVFLGIALHGLPRTSPGRFRVLDEFGDMLR
jgi:hypothetical protein